jgi:hypothetical protein
MFLLSIKSTFIILIFTTITQYGVYGQKSGHLVPVIDNDVPQNDREILPTVLIACLVRNKAHTLPYFLSALENLDYPQDRISIW